MTNKFFPVFIDNALDELEELLPVVNSGSFRFKQLRYVCSLFRQVGILKLFESDDARNAIVWFHKSAACFAFGLDRLPPDQIVLSRCDAFWDAIISQDVVLIKRLVELIEVPFQFDLEYEDDYFFLKSVKDILSGKSAKFDGTRQEFQNSLDDEDDPRFIILNALANPDQEAFEQAFVDLLTARDDLIEKYRENETYGMEYFSSEGAFYAEGAALFIIAEKVGLQVGPDYKFIPGTIRQKVNYTKAEDSWKTLG